MFESTFLTLMQAIVKATSIEEEYADLASDVRKLTQHEMHRLARLAAEKFVQLAKATLTQASKEQLDGWKREAIEFALKKRK